MRNKTSTLSVFLLMCFSFCQAEGSKELNSSGNPLARRVFLSQGIGQLSGLNWYKITTRDSIEARNNFYAFANIGDSIAIASSALGIGIGSFEIIRPDGTVAMFYNTAPGDTGRILAGGGSRNRELQGPFGLYGGGPGYIPRVFVADQQGVYIIRLLSPLPSSGASNYLPFITPYANADFLQPNNNTIISAFDISIITNGSIQTGRVYSNYMVLTAGGLSQGGAMKRYATQYIDLDVLTREGYQYEVSLKGLAPYGYFIYTDNVGLQLNDGVSPAYASIRYQGPGLPPDTFRIFVPDIDPETTLETKHKMFFNTPDATMPATALMNNTTVWLYATLTTSTYNVSVNFNLTQVPNQMAGDFNFNIANFGIRYKFIIDLNNNGIFGDSSDRVFNNTTVAGSNTFSWDGLDGFGNIAAMGCIGVRIEFVGGELHIPLADAENFRGGIEVKRLNGNGTLPNYTLHWNDLPLNDSSETPAGRFIKRTPAAGISSQATPIIDTTARRWEIQEAGPTENYTGIPTHTTSFYGDTRYIDQWAYDTLSTNVFTPLVCFFPLPIQLKSFTAARENDNLIKLNWSLTEKATLPIQFILQRSHNGSNFSDVALIDGKNQTTFSVLDILSKTGSHSYRLKWKNTDHTYKYSPIRTVTVSLNNSEMVRIYPNPASKKIFVQLPGGSGLVQIKILNLMGQIIKTEKSNSSLVSLSVDHIPPGKYILEIISDKGIRIKTQKITIGK